MREVVTYIAFDDTVFDDEQKCRAYENTIQSYMIEAAQCYHFFDGNEENIGISFASIDECLANFDYAFQTCEYIDVTREISEAAFEYLYREFGFDLPQEVGSYKYDYYGEFGGGWIRQE